MLQGAGMGLGVLAGGMGCGKQHLKTKSQTFACFRNDSEDAVGS